MVSTAKRDICWTASILAVYFFDFDRFKWIRFLLSIAADKDFFTHHSELAASLLVDGTLQQRPVD